MNNFDPVFDLVSDLILEIAKYAKVQFIIKGTYII